MDEEPDAVLLRQLECLARSGIQVLPATEITKHFVLELDGFILLVERTASGFGQIGSPGLLTDSGFAALTWRGAASFFIAKNFERPATAEQVTAIRAFTAIVKNCIGG